MEQPGNQRIEIAYDTFPDEDVKADVKTSDVCRRGCGRPKNDASDYCDEHHEDQKRYMRECMARKRERWDAENRCGRCGGKRMQGRKSCARCVVELGHLNVKVDVKTHADRVSARTVVSRTDADGFLRKRYHGGKKGAPSLDAQDDFERKILEQGIERYLSASKWLASPEGKATSKEERKAARLAALGQLALAARAAEDILDRHRYDEKREKQKQEQLAATAREIAKRGR